MKTFSNPWLIPNHSPMQPQAFIIPSYALKNRTMPTLPTRAQIELAREWWRKFPNAKIIMCTGDNQGLGITNASVMVDYATSLGIPRENQIAEDRSKNTWENLWNAREIIRAQGLAQPTIVTLDLYTRRAVATARKQGWGEFYWLSVYAHGEPAYGTKRFQTYSRATIFVYELIAMAYSKIAGWV